MRLGRYIDLSVRISSKDRIKWYNTLPFSTVYWQSRLLATFDSHNHMSIRIIYRMGWNEAQTGHITMMTYKRMRRLKNWKQKYTDKTNLQHYISLEVDADTFLHRRTMMYKNCTFVLSKEAFQSQANIRCHSSRAPFVKNVTQALRSSWSRLLTISPEAIQLLFCLLWHFAWFSSMGRTILNGPLLTTLHPW